MDISGLGWAAVALLALGFLADHRNNHAYEHEYAAWRRWAPADTRMGIGRGRTGDFL